MNRRAFWKFLAASPAAAIAPLVASRTLQEVPTAAITIEGENVILSNLNIEGSVAIKSAPGARAALHGCYIKANGDL